MQSIVVLQTTSAVLDVRSTSFSPMTITLSSHTNVRKIKKGYCGAIPEEVQQTAQVNLWFVI